ncbi:nucleotidyltransferase family protein [Chitinivorax sp. B]|uniref:nucleotidyltransferase family protein n=1 Tax=Chitinivorax sp. B TaxID=2502235 RepID=UPI0010F94CC8|nr:nucleotidyltransferase family protein [Chitinivorax sp. B]
MQWLYTARDLNLPDWYLAAGCIRNRLWDHLHGYAEPSGEQDIDLIYFDPDASAAQDHALSQQLSSQFKQVWEIVNQAHIHHWYRQASSQPIEPMLSSLDALGRWPETATCIGVRLMPDDRLQFAMPCGLDDLFNLIWRQNPAFSDRDIFLQRTASKHITTRWPRVCLEQKVPIVQSIQKHQVVDTCPPRPVT